MSSSNPTHTELITPETQMSFGFELSFKYLIISRKTADYAIMYLYLLSNSTKPDMGPAYKNNSPGGIISELA